MRVYTVTFNVYAFGTIKSSQSTTDMEQAMRFTASLADDVENAMKRYGFVRFKTLDVHISVRNVNEADIPEHTGKWFWCTLNGDVDNDVKDIPSGEDQIDVKGLSRPDLVLLDDVIRPALELASPLLAYKIEGKIFERWPEVVEYCKNKFLG